MELRIQSNSPEAEAVAKKFPGLSDGCDYALNRLFTSFVFADRKRDSDGKPIGQPRQLTTEEAKELIRQLNDEY